MDSDWEDDFHLYKLRKNRSALVRDILPDVVVDHLYAEFILSQEEYELIMCCNQTTAGRNRKLLDIVSTKGPNGFNELRTALKTDHPWLVELLDNTPRPLKTEAKPVKEDKSSIIPDKSNVQDADIDEVVKSLLSCGSLSSWKFLARKLGLSEDKINEIEYRSLRDIRAQIYEMLFYWRGENTYRATVDCLCEALRQEGRIATAGNYLESQEQGTITPNMLGSSTSSTIDLSNTYHS